MNLALDKFLELHGDVEKLLARLTDAQANHYDALPDDVTWANVNELEHVENELIELVDFVYQEGEYA